MPTTQTSSGHSAQPSRTIQVRLHEQVVDDLRLLRVAWKVKSVSEVVRRMIDQEANRFEKFKALNFSVAEEQEGKP